MGFAPLRRHGRTPAAAHLAAHLADQHVGAVRWRLPPRCSDLPARPVPKHLHSAPTLCTRPCTCTPLTAAHAPADRTPADRTPADRAPADRAPAADHRADHLADHHSPSPRCAASARPS
eukprot:scaffold124786_cov61-Phaeocystis_antarctica.AAC.6